MRHLKRDLSKSHARDLLVRDLSHLIWRDLARECNEGYLDRYSIEREFTISPLEKQLERD